MGRCSTLDQMQVRAWRESRHSEVTRPEVTVPVLPRGHSSEWTVMAEPMGIEPLYGGLADVELPKIVLLGVEPAVAEAVDTGGSQYLVA